MNYVDENKVKEILEETRFLMQNGILSLKKLKDINAEIKMGLASLENADGKKVKGSNNIKITPEKIEHSCLQFEIKNISRNKDSSFMIDTKCDELSDDLCKIEIHSLLGMTESAEMIAIYMKQIESRLVEVGNSKLSFIDKVKLLPNLIEKDANNNYQILNNTPIRKRGPLFLNAFDRGINYNGEYLKFINSYGTNIIAPFVKILSNEDGKTILENMTDEEKEKYIGDCERYVEGILEHTNKFSDKYINDSLGKIDDIYLSYINVPSTDPGDGTYVAGWYNYNTKDITIEMESGTQNEYTFIDSIKSTYTHELGHAFDSSSIYHEISSSDEWKNIYNQVLKNDPNHQYLREYAHSAPEECFAEAINEYYNTPEDLKELEIDIPGCDNLFDYMNNLLKDEGDTK